MRRLDPNTSSRRDCSRPVRTPPEPRKRTRNDRSRRDDRFAIGHGRFLERVFERGVRRLVEPFRQELIEFNRCGSGASQRHVVVSSPSLLVQAGKPTPDDSEKESHGHLCTNCLRESPCEIQTLERACRDAKWGPRWATGEQRSLWVASFKVDPRTVGNDGSVFGDGDAEREANDHVVLT